MSIFLIILSIFILVALWRARVPIVRHILFAAVCLGALAVSGAGVGYMWVQHARTADAGLNVDALGRGQGCPSEFPFSFNLKNNTTRAVSRVIAHLEGRFPGRSSVIFSDSIYGDAIIKPGESFDGCWSLRLPDRDAFEATAVAPVELTISKVVFQYSDDDEHGHSLEQNVITLNGDLGWRRGFAVERKPAPVVDLVSLASPCKDRRTVRDQYEVSDRRRNAAK